MRKLLLLLLAILPALAVAQDSKPQQPTTSAQTATVYVYRYKQFVGSALSPSVYCDEAELARADNGRYFTATIEPGKHSFHSNDRQSGIDLDLKAGESYFIRVDIAAGMMKGHGRLTLMSAEQGSYELRSDKLKPLDGSKVKDQARVSVAEAHPEVQAPARSSATIQPAAQTQPSSTSQDHPAHIVTISDPNGAANSGSELGDQGSLGEAARRAKEKKKDPPQG